MAHVRVCECADVRSLESDAVWRATHLWANAAVRQESVSWNARWRRTRPCNTHKLHVPCLEEALLALTLETGTETSILGRKECVPLPVARKACAIYFTFLIY